MSELARLQELNDRLKLVPRGTSVDELRRNASDFTHAAAKMLHGEGWRRVRKTTGENVDNMDVDKLVHQDTGELRDIVVSAGASTAVVAWQHVGFLSDRSRYIEVRPDEPPAPSLPADDDDMSAALLELANALDNFTNVLSNAFTFVQLTNNELIRTRTAVERLAERRQG